MGKSSPSPPTPVDPTAVANAQANANIRTAQENAALNRVDQTGPTGSIDWKRGPNGGWSQTTSLSPDQQGHLDQANWLATHSLASLKLNPQKLQFGVDPAQLQTNVSNPGVPVQSVQGAGALSRGVDANPLQSSLNLNGVSAIPQADNAAYNKAVNSVYGQATSRLNPQWNQDQTRLETQLTDQGIPQNSDAWNKAMSEFSRNKNDAYNSAFNNAVTQGSQVQNNLFNMGLQANQAGVSNALTSGNFANQAQAQGFGQNLSNANLNNAAQGQRFGENLQSGQFADQAAQQRLAQALQAAGFGNSSKEQMFQNGMQNANLNNTNQLALTSQLMQEAGMPSAFSQVSLPGIAGAQVAPTDVLGANSLAAQTQMANYQNQVAQNSSAKGGMGSLLGTLGSAAIMSDRRVKRDIKRIGRLPNGLPVYSYRYAWSSHREVGFMAQDVEKKIPSAVVTLGGIKHVDYAQAVAA